MAYQAIHKYDALPSSPDERDFRVEYVDVSALPDHVVLPAVPILQQANEGSCVGHGCAGARETLELIAAMAGVPEADCTPERTAANFALQVPIPLSRKFIYYEARLLEGTPTEDSGAEVRDGCKVMQQMGVCTEDQFPYVAGDFADVPPDLDVTAAAAYKIATYTRLTTPDEVRMALSQGKPVVIGISVYQSFEQNVGADGLVPMPNTRHEQLLGGHCLYLRGYKPDSKKSGTFLYVTPNSWGDGWADHGVCYLQQAYLADPNLTSDMWAISL